MSCILRWPFFMLSLLALFFPLTTYGFELQQVTEQVQKNYDSMISMQAEFEQATSVQGMPHRKKYEKGTIIIQKPGLLRWDYIEPEYKVFVSDGIEFSMYVRADNQMFISEASDYLKEDYTYRLFTGKAKLHLDFLIENGEADVQEEGLYCLKLTPKKENGHIASLYLFVDTEKFQLQRLRLVSSVGGITDFRFSNIVMNKKYPETVFEFSPPRCTEILWPGGGNERPADCFAENS